MKGRPHASCVCLSPCALNTLSAQAHHGVVISTLDDLFVPRCPAGTTGSFSQKMYASLLVSLFFHPTLCSKILEPRTPFYFRNLIDGMRQTASPGAIHKAFIRLFSAFMLAI
eukprot:1194954-Prorocentrum_minimum.AAC.5